MKKIDFFPTTEQFGAASAYVKLENDYNVGLREDTIGEVTLELGSNAVVLEKLFGPTGGASLRIHADVTCVAWVIERWNTKAEEYREWCSVPLQLEEDYDES